MNAEPNRTAERTRNWTLTFCAVIVNEALVILCLWLLSRHFSY
jgi:hypothetical protein